MPATRQMELAASRVHREHISQRSGRIHVRTAQKEVPLQQTSQQVKHTAMVSINSKVSSLLHTSGTNMYGKIVSIL